jgi:hypothetical protein
MPSPTTAPQRPNKKKALIAVLALALGCGALVGVGFGYRALFGSPVGGKCGRDGDCKLGGICISKRCYQSCKADADCESGWHCGTTVVDVTRRGRYSLSSETKESSRQICFPPKSPEKSPEE